MGLLVTLAFANILTAAALVFVSLSFATDHWIDITIQRDLINRTIPNLLELTDNPLYYSRHRGLFRTCYDGDTVFLDTPADGEESEYDVVGGHCLTEKGYELSRRESTTGYGSDYDTRIHLMRCHFAVLLLAIIFVLIAFVFGALSCYKPKMTWFRIAGILDFMAAFFVGAGMAFFHGYEYLEKEKIDKSEFYKHYSTTSVGNKLLEDYMQWTYGYSYILGWIAMAVSAISAILFLMAAFKLAKRYRREKRPLDNSHEYSGRHNKGAELGNDYGRYPGSAYPGSYPPTMAPSGYPMAPSQYPTMDMGQFSSYGY